MAGKAVEAIVFDLDNTLIDTAHAGHVAIQKTNDFLKTTLGLDDDAIICITEKFKKKLLLENYDAASGRTIDEVRVGHWKESIQEVVGSCARSSLATECYDLWKSSRLELLSITPEIRRLLAGLKTRYRLLLLTNGESQTQREKIDAVGCEGLFDFIVIGGDYDEEKPSLSIFRQCFSLLGMEPKDCVMVGDSLDTDIAGGLNAGVRATVWINNSGPSHSIDSVKPDYTIPSVLGLTGILKELNTIDH